MEPLTSVAMTAAAGILGDFRGVVRPGKLPRRQVSVIEAESWQAAVDELGLFEGTEPPWFARRANLCVSGIQLPREAGRVIAFGPSCLVEVTMECDPCSRMDEVAHGLQAALTPDWRGGLLCRVLEDGEISVGDEVRILE